MTETYVHGYHAREHARLEDQAGTLVDLLHHDTAYPAGSAVLERPLDALLKLGGTITVIEGDHGAAYFHPDSAAARAAIDCQITLQRDAGGNSLIGRELYPLLVGAGFDAAVRALHRTTEADGVFCYTFFKGVGAKTPGT